MFFFRGKITIRLISELNYFKISDSWVWVEKDLKKLFGPALPDLMCVIPEPVRVYMLCVWRWDGDVYSNLRHKELIFLEC